MVSVDALESLRSQGAELLVVEVGQEKVAVAAAAVLEILESAVITPVPEGPDYLEGAVVVRGIAAPLLDLRRKLYVDPTPESQILLVRDHPDDSDPSMAVRVDQVVELVPVTLGSILPPPSHIETAGRYLLGALHRDGHPVLVLDLPEIVSSEERLDLAALLAQLPENDTPPPE